MLAVRVNLWVLVFGDITPYITAEGKSNTAAITQHTPTDGNLNHNYCLVRVQKLKVGFVVSIVTQNLNLILFVPVNAQEMVCVRVCHL